MRGILAGWLLLPLLAWGAPGYPLQGEDAPCADCHSRQQEAFQRSRMAMAAGTASFLDEWQGKGRPKACLECHAPSRSQGVICVDCHGEAGHPYPELQLPMACARCHDAPGEITLRSFRNSPAARRGEDCLSCHLAGEGFNHDFRGPTRAGFLEGIARLTIAFRREPAGDTALLRILHRAGHALPGGTTGRAVWLLVEQRDTRGQRVASRPYRFGWLHSKAGWLENTLPPGVGQVIEVPLHEAARSIHAKLIYRFRAGELNVEDPDQVVLVDESRPLTFRSVPPPETSVAR